MERKEKEATAEPRIAGLKGQAEYWAMEMGRCGQEENQERLTTAKG